MEIYWCDRKKNKDCPNNGGRLCQKKCPESCGWTSKKEYALLDPETGKPMYTNKIENGSSHHIDGDVGEL